MQTVSNRPSPPAGVQAALGGWHRRPGCITALGWPLGPVEPTVALPGSPALTICSLHSLPVTVSSPPSSQRGSFWSVVADTGFCSFLTEVIHITEKLEHIKEFEKEITHIPTTRSNPC